MKHQTDINWVKCVCVGAGRYKKGCTLTKECHVGYCHSIFFLHKYLYMYKTRSVHVFIAASPGTVEMISYHFLGHQACVHCNPRMLARTPKKIPN